MEEEQLRQSFYQIIQQHKGIFHKVARTYCKNESDREDLIQEIMLQVWRALPHYNKQFAMSTWLYRISLNTAISFYRKYARQNASQVPLNEHLLNIREPETSKEAHTLFLLEQFINELNDLDKALILLYLEDKSHAEIAEILGLSLTNISTKVGRIKEKLKKRFSQFNLS